MASIFDQARNVLKTLKQGKANPLLQGIYDLPASAKILAQRAPQAVNQLVMDPRVASNFARNTPQTANIKVPGMQSVANFSANTAQSFGQGLQDMAMGYNKVSSKPGAFNKLQGSAQMVAGAGKTIAPFTLPFQVANTFTSVPQTNNMFINPVQRFSAGVLRGMSGDEKLAENVKNKNDINLNLFGTKIGIDPAETAGQMVGFVKNPINKQLFKLTNSVFPTGSLAAKGTNLKKWLAVTGLRGGVENILLDLAKVPENATNEQKIAFMLRTAGVGSITELGGRGMLDVSGAVGNKVFNNKQLVQAFNELRFAYNKLNIPVATTNIDPTTGKRVTMPMWKYRLDKMGINDKGYIKFDEFLPKPKSDVANAGLYDVEHRTNKIFDELNTIDDKLDSLGVDYTKISKARRIQIDIQRDILAKKKNKLLSEMDELSRGQPSKSELISPNVPNPKTGFMEIEQKSVPTATKVIEGNFNSSTAIPATHPDFMHGSNIPQSRVAQPPLSDVRKMTTGGYTNVRALDNPLIGRKLVEGSPTLQKSTSAINLEPQGIKQQSQGLPNTEAIRSTMNQPISSPYNTQEYIKELTEKQQQAGGAGGSTGLKQKASNFLAEVKAKLVDETAPLTDILTASEKKNQFKVLPKQDIRLQIDRALRSKNLASQFAEDNGLVDAIKKAPDLNALDQYMIAKHAANVEKQGIKTGRDLGRDQQLIQDLAPQYETIAQQVNQYSRKLLDYAVKSGLIDEKLAKGLVEKYPEYVPLNRIFSELEQPAFRGTGKGVASLSRQTVVQKLAGSEREIRSPIESLLLKTQDAFSQGERNIAAKQLASYKSLPGFEGLIKEVDAGSRAPHTFSFIDNGVKKTYATTREIEAAAKALNVEQMGILGKIISTPTRMLQLGATGLNIPFVVTNVVKDEVTGFINSNRAAKTSILNPANYVKALFSAVKHDELYKDLVRNAGGGTSFDIARDAPNLSIAKIRSPKMYTVRHPLELLRTIENLVGRGEELGRIKNFEGTRQALLKEGRTLQDANLLGGQAARENTANFARRGSFGRVINWMIPFFNAGIQGSRQLVRSFQNAPAQTSTKIAATIFTPIAVATAWNLSDPLRKQIYADIPQYEKENNIILIPPDVTQDERGRYNVIKIPLPPGLSNLGTIVRRSLETTQGLDAIKFGEIATNLITAGTSVDVTSGNKLASTFTPQLAKPLVESTTNTNLFTGQRIIPDYMKNRPAELQTRPGVTPIATGIGKLLNVSPLMIENFAQTQLGGLGSQLLGKESPIGNLERRFKKASGGELLDRVYEDSTKIQAINSQAKSLFEAGKKEEALKLIQSNKDLLLKTSKVKTIRSEVDTLQEYKNKVKADSRLTQEQKNKVLTLIQQKLNELSNVYNSVNQL